MKFEDILGAREEIIALGEEGSKYLSEMNEPDDYLKNRKVFYGRLVATVALFFASIVFVVVANVITITRPVGEPYITTQTGHNIKIKNYTVEPR